MFPLFMRVSFCRSVVITALTRLRKAAARLLPATLKSCRRRLYSGGPFEDCSTSAINRYIALKVMIVYNVIRVGETSKMRRRNVQPVSAKRLRIKKFIGETSVGETSCRRNVCAPLRSAGQKLRSPFSMFIELRYKMLYNS